MIDGNSPAPPTILSAAVAVTFITPSGKTQFPLPRILYVRRHVVRQALEWLKEKNPLWENITFSGQRLQQLPEDGIPIEIQSTIRHSTDIYSIIHEHEGYNTEGLTSDTENESKGAYLC